jgi:hypothetical protein
MVTAAAQGGEPPMLLAGTRLTGAEPHLGTFYGWIRPITKAAETMRVCVLIADLQSLDLPRDCRIAEETGELEQVLRQFLPTSVPIVRESEVPSLTTLAFLAGALFADHHLRRIAPLRKMHRTGQAMTVATMSYPAMMVADILTFRASHVLAKPEGRFQHTDVLNDVLARGTRRYGWPETHLAAHPKPKIDIPAGDGSGRPMKRDMPGAFNIGGATEADVLRWTGGLPVPGHSDPADQRPSRCPVIWPIWQSLKAAHPPTSPQAAHARVVADGCPTNSLSCRVCARTLALTIAGDLACTRASARSSVSPQEASSALARQAERTAQRLVRLAVGRTGASS